MLFTGSPCPVAMSEGHLEHFRSERARMNKKILDEDHLGVKRFFNLDSNAYRDGPLDKTTKEYMGLVASLVLRCDDCVAYHLDTLATECGAKREELMDALNVGLVVGGSITIPHIRRAWDLVQELLPKE